jgi:hypothetical protein
MYYLLTAHSVMNSSMNDEVNPIDEVSALMIQSLFISATVGDKAFNT